MKWNYQLTLTMIASLAIILPMSAFADDQNQNDKKNGKQGGGGRQAGGKSGQQGAARASTQSAGGSGGAAVVHNSGRVNNAASGQGHVSHVSTGAATVQRSNTKAVASQGAQQGGRAVSSQQTQVAAGRQKNYRGNGSGATSVTTQNVQQNNTVTRSQRNQTHYSSNQSQYTRSNNYGGLWYPANTHNNWNQNQQYYWNNHNYQWYNGGWLIIDGGFNPYYTTGGYYN